MDSAIDPAAPDLNRAQMLLQGLIGQVRGHRGPPTRRGRRPVTPVEPEPGTYYTHVASTSSGRDARGPSGAGDAYRPDMSFLAFGSSSYVFGAPAFPLTPEGVRSTPTPVHMHSFGAYAGESSPWAVRDQSEPEGPSQPEQRQQPPRDAKGKGRRCHTGSHIFGHKKK